MTIWEAVEARDEALARVESTSAPWRAFADAALRSVAYRQRQLSSEDVWAELDRMKIPRPGEPRAMGPVLMKAVKDGLIVTTGYGRGTDPKHHRDILRLYRSTVAR